MERTVPEILNIEDYITNGNLKYINALKEKNIEVKLFCPFGYEGPWMLGVSNDSHPNEKAIVAPLSDYRNVELFTHELLHLYLDHCLGMHISAFEQIGFGKKLVNHLQNPGIFQPAICNLINNLQHYKMFPLYLECGFSQEKFLGNYLELIKPHEEIFNVNSENLKKIEYRILFAIEYGLTICLLLYETNPKNKELLNSQYFQQIKALDEYLFNKFYDNLSKWQQDNCNLRELVTEFVKIIEDFSFNTN